MRHAQHLVRSQLVIERQTDNAPAYLLGDGQHARFIPESPSHLGLVQWAEVEHSGYPLTGQMDEECFPHLLGFHQEEEAMVICLAVGRYRLKSYQPTLGQRLERSHIQFV